MQNIDHLKPLDVQYEHMLSEYSEFVSVARTKLRRDHCIHVDGLDNLRQQLSLLSV